MEEQGKILEELRLKNESLKKQLKKVFSGEKIDQKANIQSVSKDVNEVKKRIIQAKAQAKKKEKTLKDEKNQLQKVSLANSKLEKSISSLEKKISARLKEIEKNKKERQQNIERIPSLQIELAKLTAELSERQMRTISAKAKQMENASTLKEDPEMKSIEAEIRKLNRKKEDMQSEIQKLIKESNNSNSNTNVLRVNQGRKLCFDD